MYELLEIYNRLISNFQEPYIRSFYDNFCFDHRFIGIVGQRGVGKTSFMLYYLKKYYQNSDQAAYISVDNLYFSQNSLFDFVSQFYKEYAAELICIDEIHRYENWNQELKNIYDSFPKLKVIFSGAQV